MKFKLFFFLFLTIPHFSFGQDKIEELENGMIIYKKDKFGIGKTEFVDFIYDSIYHPKFDEYIMLQKNKKWGVWDFNGNQILPFEYEAIRLTRYKNQKEKGVFYVKKNGKIGTVNLRNKVIIPIIYDDISRLNEHNPEVHYVVLNGKTGISTFSGKIIIPIQYDSLYCYRNHDYIKAKKNNLVGVLNSKNKIVIPFKYQNIIFDFYNPNPNDSSYELGDLRFVVKENDVWSIIDLKGKLLINNIPEKEIFEKYGKSNITNYDFYYATVCLIEKNKNYR